MTKKELTQRQKERLARLEAFNRDALFTSSEVAEILDCSKRYVTKILKPVSKKIGGGRFI